MSNPFLQLLILLGIAVFLILRLRNVLGTRDGFEPEKDETARFNGPSHPDIIDARAEEVDHDIFDHVPANSPQAEALAQIKRLRPDFCVGEFLHGARGAYEMIFMAFQNGDLSSVRPFIGDHVANALQGAIDQRKEAGHVIDTQFLGMRETGLVSADLDPQSRVAEIAVRFVAELITVTHDAKGDVIDGDPKAVRKQKDIWTFSRHLDADDPNWQLIATS